MHTQPSASSVSSLRQGRRSEQVSVHCPTPTQLSTSSTPSLQQDPRLLTESRTFLELVCGDDEDIYQLFKAYLTLYGRHALLAKLSTLAHMQKEYDDLKRRAQAEGWLDEARLQDLITSRAQLPGPMQHQKKRQEFHEVRALLARNCASEYEDQACIIRRRVELRELPRRYRDLERAYKQEAQDARYSAGKHKAYAKGHEIACRVREAALQEGRSLGPGHRREPSLMAAEDRPDTQEQEDFDGCTYCNSSSPDPSYRLGSPRQHRYNHHRTPRYEHIRNRIHDTHHQHIYPHTRNRGDYPETEPFYGRRAPWESAVEHPCQVWAPPYPVSDANTVGAGPGSSEESEDGFMSDEPAQTVSRRATAY